MFIENNSILALPIKAKNGVVLRYACNRYKSSSLPRERWGERPEITTLRHVAAETLRDTGRVWGHELVYPPAGCH